MARQERNNKNNKKNRSERKNNRSRKSNNNKSEKNDSDSECDRLRMNYEISNEFGYDLGPNEFRKDKNNILNFDRFNMD